MSRPRSPVPSYRLHKPTGKAVVTVYQPDGTRRDVYLPGRHGSAESRAAYAALCGELLPGGVLPAPDPAVTITELCVAYLRHAETYYRHPDGTSTTELRLLRYAIRPFRAAHGAEPAAAFGPKKLKEYRETLAGVRGLARTEVNAQVGRIRRMFRWGAAEELIPEAVPGALALVEGLKRGRSAARETEPVRPVPLADYEAALPRLAVLPRAVCELMRWTAMRPAEACRLTFAEVDRTGDVWLYRPVQHKNRHRGQVRVVALGPKAQAVLAAYLDRLTAHGLTPADPAEPVFSPARDYQRENAERRARRKTPLYPSHLKRLKKDLAARRAAGIGPRRVRAAVTPATVCRAVARACAAAGVAPWHPNQLRHLRLTEVRERHGLEAAQVVGGHARADVTQIYAEAATRRAAEIAAVEG